MGIFGAAFLSLMLLGLTDLVITQSLWLFYTTKERLPVPMINLIMSLPAQVILYLLIFSLIVYIRKHRKKS